MSANFKILKQLSNKQSAVWSFLTRDLIKKRKKKKYYSSITVSRETGSGGRLIAKKVAKRLGIKYYDKKIVNMLVEETNKRKSLINSLDEKSRTFMEETVQMLFGTQNLSTSAYFRYLIKVILTLAQKKSCVILGRGANFIIPQKYTLRVRIIAPLETRIENSMKYENNTRRKAKKEIKRIHFNRKNFVKRYFQKDISNANYYDLVINTKNISLKQAVEIVVSAFKEKFPRAVK